MYAGSVSLFYMADNSTHDLLVPSGETTPTVYLLLLFCEDYKLDNVTTTPTL